MRFKRYKHKRGRPRIKYSKSEEKFYEQNKRKIISGLEEYMPKSSIKSTFFKNVEEEMRENNLSRTEAMRKVLRSRTFTTEEENFELYKREVIDKTFKGQKKNIKKYLGLPQNQKLDSSRLNQTSEGWEYSYNGKTVLLKRNPDTKTEGYEVLYA